MPLGTPREKDFETVKKTIRSLLLSTKNGLTPVQLTKDYMAMIGNPIPVQELGFPSLFELLKHMPDAVAMHKSRGGTLMLRGLASDSCIHVAQLVSRQKATKSYTAMKSGMRAPTSTKRVPAPTIPPRSRVPLVPETVKLRLNQLLISYPNGLPLLKFQEAYHRRFGYYLHPKDWGFDTVLDALATLPDIIKLKSNGPDHTCIIYSARINLKGGSKDTESSLTSLEGSSYSKKPASSKKITFEPVPVQISERIHEVLKSSKSGVKASDIPTKYKNYFNEDLPWQSLGYASIVEMLFEMADIADLEKPTKDGEYLVFAKKQDTAGVSAATALIKKPTSIPETLSLLVCRILEGSPPVPVHQFPKFFEKITTRELPLIEYGFSTVEEFLACIPEISIIEDEKKEKVIKVTQPEKEVKKEDEATKGKTLSDTCTTKKILSNPKPEFSYSVVSIPKGSKPFGVYVTYVKTPSYLCIQIIGEQTTQALDSLHDDMAHFYNGISGDKLVVSNPEIGSPCCARFNNDGYWYRATILEHSQPDVVQIRYVDYGNNDFVPLNAIRQPKPHYLALPAQCIECRLANICPPGSTWSKRACRILVEMTKDKAIAAMATSTKGDVVSLCLCDTTTDKDIHINDYLIEEGLACLSSDAGKESLDSYQMEHPPVEVSSEEKEVRLPHTVSSVAESASKQYFPPLTHPSPQQFYQLMFMQQQMQHPSLAPPYFYGPSSLLPNPPLPINVSVPAPPGFDKPPHPYPANFYPGGMIHMQPPQPVIPPSPLPSTFAPTFTPASTMQAAGPPPLATVQPLQHIPPLATVAPAKVSNSNKENVPQPPQVSSANDEVPVDMKKFEKRVLMKKVVLPKPYTLHLIDHNDTPCAISKEISSWFWEFDLLQYHLNKKPNSPSGQPIFLDKVPELYQLIVDSQSPVLWEAKAKDQIIVYSLEVLPKIVEILNGSPSLRVALNDILKEWKNKGSDFWIVRNEAALKENSIVNLIKKLQHER